MKNLANYIIFILLASSCSSQEFKAEFDMYFQDGDTVNQRKVLAKWERKSPDDPELYVSYLNYYVRRSRHEVLFLEMEDLENDSGNSSDLQQRAVGQIKSHITFNPELFRKGLDKIEEGILHNPDRLDMRLGKIHALCQAGDWRRYTEEVVRTIRYAAEKKNEWSWTPEVDCSIGEQEFLSFIQDYQKTLYNTGEDSLLSNIRTIAQEVLKVYPRDTKSLNNLAITYLLAEKYDLALETLQAAEKLTPTDPVILLNFGYAYREKGEIEEAIKYYEKTLQYGTKQQTAFAREQLEKLKKSNE